MLMVGRSKVAASIYLIHFSEPLICGGRTAQHYMGSTILPVEERMKRHANGDGAKLMRLVKEAGIAWSVARTWDTTKEERYRFERQMKKGHNYKRLCPTCRENVP